VKFRNDGIQAIREAELSGQLEYGAYVYFEVDMCDAAGVPAGIDGREGDLAVAVRELDAAQLSFELTT
jgi:hypothetical protein